VSGIVGIVRRGDTVPNNPTWSLRYGLLWLKLFQKPWFSIISVGTKLIFNDINTLLNSMQIEGEGRMIKKLKFLVSLSVPESPIDFSLLLAPQPNITYWWVNVISLNTTWPKAFSLLNISLVDFTAKASANSTGSLIYSYRWIFSKWTTIPALMEECSPVFEADGVKW